ncbi:MAG: Fe-S cluster assembly protein HesB [Nanoarchaeota archaeon]|nr:Fe-S cluster assembly protein HesB [Nanoarchaeota archaeon]
MQQVPDVSASTIKEFQDKIFRFYDELGRHNLSFRQTKNPYHIHISEIMLSQTQVSRVEKYFNTWIETFPTPQDVIKTSNEELLQLWQGLGYNSRVLNFKEACRQIIEEFKGEYPTSKEELMKLKGVGSYVASAICAFSYNQDIGVVDTNIRRILIYEGFANEHTPIKKLEEIAQQLVPKGRGREWNNALMDYGALKLTAQKSSVKSLGSQGKFIGSPRYIRSFIVKECLHNSQCSIQKVKEECLKYQLSYDDIIEKMIVQKIIYTQGDSIKIKN